MDDVLNNRFSRFNDLKVCNTPQILLDVGCAQLPMMYSQNHLKEALKPKDGHTNAHRLIVEQIKRMPEFISEPVMIYDSLTKDGSIIIVTSDIDVDNMPIIASVKLNGNGTYNLQNVDSNFITSYYGRNNFENHINEVITQDKMLFCDKEKSQVMFSVLGLQSSKGLNNLDYDTIIHQSRNIVKPENNNIPAENSEKQDKNSVLKSGDIIGNTPYKFVPKSQSFTAQRQDK